MDSSIHSKLRFRHPRLNSSAVSSAVPFSAETDAIDEENASASQPKVKAIPGQVSPIQENGSEARGDEPGDHGALQGAQRKSARRMHSADSPVSSPVCVYALLQYSIELRQAPFIGWIHDLSAKDPYYILPVVMGITMFISQKMTPMAPSTDPTQAKMMMIMPVVFTLMFFNYSSGLNLYFLCSNIFQVAFQKIAERWTGDGTSRDGSNSKGA